MKPGDRVAVYGNTERVESDYPATGPAFRRGDKGTIEFINSGTEAMVELDKGGFVDVHVKQLRKLKRKKPREIYVVFGNDGRVDIWSEAHFPGAITMREVK